MSMKMDNLPKLQKPMKTINKQAENMGGLLKLWAVPPEDISISGDLVTIISEANMISIYVQEDSGSFDEDLTRSFVGHSYKVEIKATVPCDNKDTLALISEMERKSKYLVIYLDGNGNYKLAGNKSTPLRFSAKATTGKGTFTLNRYDISFTGSQLNRAVIIQNPFD